MTETMDFLFMIFHNKEYFFVFCFGVLIGFKMQLLEKLFKIKKLKKQINKLENTLNEVSLENKILKKRIEML